jgi:molybdate transport system ATP-binding protein
MTVELGGDRGEPCRIEVPLVRGSVRGTRLTVGVRSGDILLATEEPRGLSARNILPGHVTAIEERGEQTLVRVACGVEWTSSVTKQSVEELGLEVGQRIWLAFKTYSCRVFDPEG